jgi:hypothetical protein
VIGPTALAPLGNLGNGNHLLQSSTVVQTEPFPQS